MRVIVIGAGEAGFHIARRLVQEHQDVVLVDREESVIEAISDKLDALMILGNGANPRVLAEAGLKEAGMLIAVSSDDAANLGACHLAAANDVPMKIARVGDPAYFREDLDIRGRDFGADLLINPAQEVAANIERLIAAPGATEAAEVIKRVTTSNFAVLWNHAEMDDATYDALESRLRHFHVHDDAL
ncbi:MAG: NAD-binding protein, partial [Nitrospinota bacterium]|nr:NAD-binding protein [Nitrospinota bacterium]